MTAGFAEAANAHHFHGDREQLREDCHGVWYVNDLHRLTRSDDK